jgi:hypothetical protein
VNQSRGEDVRSSKWIEPPELPWPLRFDFVQVVDSDTGDTSWMCFGLEIGRPIPADGGDISAFELQPAHLAAIAKNFHPYMRMAELRLTCGDEGYQEAAEIRGVMGTGTDTNDPVYLSVMLDEFENRQRSGERGVKEKMTRERHMSRFTVMRKIEKAREIREARRTAG